MSASQPSAEEAFDLKKWFISLGVEAIRTALDGIIYRKSPTDLNLVLLGLALHDYLLGRELRIPVGFSVPLAV
jgi:hypothetical protein